MRERNAPGILTVPRRRRSGMEVMIMDVNELIRKQKAYFATGMTMDVNRRIHALKKLYHAVKTNERKISAALQADLGKSSMEAYMCETGLVLSELSFMISHCRRYAADRRVPTNLPNFHASSFVMKQPYGCVLIMSPWNYPFMLTIEPLADAIAAGNTAILKPSAYSPATSALIARLIGECFPPEYVAVVTGGRKENSQLLDCKFDKIFFTGSKEVGRVVMSQAAKHLTPVTLELGGKSPCIVDNTANIRLAAKRIVFGKYLNCGQTCVAPDYVLVHADVKEAFITAVKDQIAKQFTSDPLHNADYGKIINEKHYQRIMGLIDAEKVVYGGQGNPETMQIAPTVMDNVTWEDAVMGEEIFGPVMPILTFTSIEEVIGTINAHPSPLALYIFSGSKSIVRKVTSRCSFGGGCVNDTIIHLATSRMAFGGVGESGMGSYHGRKGFDEFTHEKSIVDKKTWIDLPFRYQKYAGWKAQLIRMFLR